MGSIQSINNNRKRYRASSSTIKPIDQSKYKRQDRFRTTMRSITLRALAARNYKNSVSSSSYDSIINNSSCTSPTTLTTVNSQLNTEAFISDFDHQKLSTLTGLSEIKINELHREFLLLSNNGRLTFERYKSMLETLPNQQSSLQLEQLARQTFTLFDKDGNNYLDFAEFIAAYITMEKNELCLNGKYQQKESPKIKPITRRATTYYSPQRNLVDIPSRTTYLSSYYYPPPSSERYVYASSQYSLR